MKIELFTVYSAQMLSAYIFRKPHKKHPAATPNMYPCKNSYCTSMKLWSFSVTWILSTSCRTGTSDDIRTVTPCPCLEAHQFGHIGGHTLDAWTCDSAFAMTANHWLRPKTCPENTVFWKAGRVANWCAAHLLPWSGNIDGIQISDHFHIKCI